jgi:hypothetical protein
MVLGWRQTKESSYPIRTVVIIYLRKVIYHQEIILKAKILKAKILIAKILIAKILKAKILKAKRALQKAFRAIQKVNWGARDL